MLRAQCPCRRIVFEYDADAIRPGKRVTHRCRDCRTVDILEGTEAGTIERHERPERDDRPPARAVSAR